MHMEADDGQVALAQQASPPPLLVGSGEIWLGLLGCTRAHSSLRNSQARDFTNKPAWQTSLNRGHLFKSTKVNKANI